jgi:CheY-like chemotaxis protein
MIDKENQKERGRRILVVEDFDDNRYLLSRLLEMDGFQIKAVANGAEALEAIGQQLPDLVLTDLIMPQVGGLELIRRLKQDKDTSSIPVIVFSAVDTGILDEARDVGASAIFQKPIDYDELSSSIKNLLKIPLSGEPQAELKPDDNLILPVKQTIVIVNEHLANYFRSDPEALRRIDPFKFESVVAELFQEEGYEVVLTPARADGGKDIYVYKKDPLTEVMFLVECKRYVPPNKVNVSIARQLYGVVQQERATGGIIVTTSYFTKPAKQFAASIPYHLFLRDFDYLTQWLKKTK